MSNQQYTDFNSFLDSELANMNDSSKGLALAIDQFLVDNEKTNFTPSDLADRFGIAPSKLRSVMRNQLKLGTKTTGKRYQDSSVKGYKIYCLPYTGEGSNNCYIACKVGINPITGEKVSIKKK